MAGIALAAGPWAGLKGLPLARRDGGGAYWRAYGMKRFAVLSEPLAKLGPVKIVVTTPAGQVGSRVVQLLLQAGVRPTFLARHPARLDPRVIERADVVQADQAEADAVVQATRDADALFWVAPDTADPDADPAAWSARLAPTRRAR